MGSLSVGDRVVYIGGHHESWGSNLDVLVGSEGEVTGKFIVIGVGVVFELDISPDPLNGKGLIRFERSQLMKISPDKGIKDELSLYDIRDMTTLTYKGCKHD